MWQSILMVGLSLLSNAEAVYQTIKYEHSDRNSIRVKKFTSGEICETGADHYSGWADIGDNHLFYWFHEARSSKLGKPLMLWLHGNPGGVGMLGLLAGHGPCRAQEDGEGLVYHPQAWSEEFNMIYIDQPVNVGFSYSNRSTGHSRTEDSSLDLIAFLKLFLYAFPDFVDRPLYIGGEAFGGRYVPMLGAAILEYNSFFFDPKDQIPLSGLLVGNGWTSPRDQFESIYQVGCYPYKGLPHYFNETECAHISEIYDRCSVLLEACESVPDGAVCLAAGSFCDSNFNWDSIRPNDKYDRRRTCRPEDCYRKTMNSLSWLNSPEAWNQFEIEEQTGYGLQQIDSMNMSVFEAYLKSGDYYTSSLPALKKVLDYSADVKLQGQSGIDVLYFSGSTDLAWNPVGYQRMLERIRWRGHADFVGTAWEELKWNTSEGDRAGRYKAVDELWMAELENAGRLSYDEQPESVLNLLKFWLHFSKSKKVSRIAHSNQQTVLDLPSEL